jgi:hypothetical protein
MGIRTISGGYGGKVIVWDSLITLKLFIHYF